MVLKVGEQVRILNASVEYSSIFLFLTLKGGVQRLKTTRKWK